MAPISRQPMSVGQDFVVTLTVLTHVSFYWTTWLVLVLPCVSFFIEPCGLCWCCPTCSAFIGPYSAVLLYHVSYISSSTCLSFISPCGLLWLVMYLTAGGPFGFPLVSRSASLILFHVPSGYSQCRLYHRV